MGTSPCSEREDVRVGTKNSRAPSGDDRRRTGVSTSTKPVSSRCQAWNYCADRKEAAGYLDYGEYCEQCGRRNSVFLYYPTAQCGEGLNIDTGL